MLAWLLLTTPYAHGGVVINEILADPGSVVDANCDGLADSTDDEFVEIVNIGPGSFDLSDAMLEDANGEVFTFPPGTVIDELDAVVVFSGGTPVLDGTASGIAPWCVNAERRATILVAGGSLSLNNSGDTIVVRDSSGIVLDEYAYGTTANDDQSIVRDLELIGNTFVKHSTVGTGDLASPGSMADLRKFEIPSGKTTPSGSCDSAADARGVVVNEFVSNAPGTDDGFEWVEIYNGSGGAIDLSGWALASGTSAFSPGDPFPGGTVLANNAYLVVAQSAKVAGADLVNAGWSLGNATSSSDGLRLEDCDGAVADTVIYGDPNDDEFLDDEGNIASSLAPSPAEGASAARLPDGADTDRSGSDFGELALPTPGFPNDAQIDSPCGGPLTGVVVNELVANPEGADESYEWVELFHAGNEAVDLTGWKIQTATSSWATYHEFKGGTLSPGEFLLVGGSMVPGTDVVTDKSIGNGSSNSDGVRILDCASFPVDTALYGSPNDDELTDDLGDIATRTAAAAGEGASLQRVEDGYDTNDSQADFAETYEPSPGASNPVLEPVVCVASEGDLTINEFVPDPDGADDGFEWIEIHNAGSSPVSVAGWGVAAGTSDYGSLDIVFPGGTTVPAGAFFLVASGEGVEGADLVIDFSLGNGTGTDGLQFVDCDGNVVDTVVYGDEGNEDQMTDDEGEVVEPYGDPGSNESLARDTDGGDTDSADDWIVTGLPTPGASNERAGSTGTGGDIGQGGGCGGKKNDSAPGDGEAPDTREPSEGGCMTVPAPMGGLEVLVLLVAGLRRRRR